MSVSAARPISAAPAVVVDHLSFAWPDGSRVFAGLSCAFPPGRTGLIGANGSGKTTLLRLIAGRLTPQAGAISVHGSLAWLPQRRSTVRAATVGDLLGIGEVRRALRAIEAGSVDPADFDAVGDRWDVEPRAVALLGALGLADEDGDALLDRPAGTLSGGQAASVALAGVRLRGSAVTLLDEPTNDLDGSARRRLYGQIDAWPGALVVVSHDRDLLEHVDQILDLDPPGPRAFGGPFSAYERRRAEERLAAERRLRDAEGEVRQARRQTQVEQQRLHQRDRVARREVARGNVDKATKHTLQNRSEKRAARKDAVHARLRERAEGDLRRADAAARRPDEIRIAMPDTAVARTKRIAALQVGDVALEIVGPQRVRIDGDNGVGKSTLLDLLSGRPAPWSPRVFADPARLSLPPTVPVGALSQRIGEIDAFPDPLEALRSAAPGRSPREARALLARFLVAGAAAVRPLGALSGGERFRVALARILFARPAPRLLVLDEPTNDLDMASTGHLAQALAGYRGALVVVTHDEWLAGRIAADTVWRLERGASGTVVRSSPRRSARAG